MNASKLFDAASMKISCSAHFSPSNATQSIQLEVQVSQEIHIHSEQVIGKNKCHNKQAAREMI